MSELSPNVSPEPSRESLPLGAKPPVRVCIVIDVEEEGLFTGHYPRKPGVRNIAALSSLAFLTREYGIPLTLVCAHSVFADADARKHLEYMRDHLGAEIGAHLHHWSTPPFRDGIDANPARYLPAHALPPDLLREKLTSLFTAAADFQGQPVTTFRMGRWDAHVSLWPHLAEQGVRVDSSIRPWQYPAGWRDHFLAPTSPYTVEVMGKRIVEVPDTAVPLCPGLARLWRAAPAPLMHRAHFIGVMTTNPVYHSLTYMKTAARLLLARGGQVLGLTWHSSEIMPNATPHLPSQAHVTGLLDKVARFLRWLGDQRPVLGVTLGQMEGCHAPLLDAEALQLPGDWHP